MRSATGDETRDLIEQVLRSGLILTGLLDSLLEELPEDAFPGESSGAVLIEMLTGSVRPVVAAAGLPAARQLTELLGAVTDKAIADLRAAVDRTRGD